MLKKLHLSASREEFLGFFVGLALFLKAFTMVKDHPTLEGYHTMNWPFVLILSSALAIIAYTMHLYLKQEYENSTAKFYTDINECRHLLLRKFHVVQIIKRYSKDPTLVVYDVFFEEQENTFFSKIIKPRQILRVSTKTKHGVALLRSSIFQFSEEGRNLSIDRLDKNNFSKDYTNVEVRCDPGVKLHEKSVNNFEYIFPFLHD